jgi:hypothetical protein
MRSRTRARRATIVILLLLLAGVAALGYTGYAGTTVYQHLDSGRQELVAAQASLNAASRTADGAQLQSAAAELKQAEADFADAQQRSMTDPALRLVAGLGPAGEQIAASAQLAAIGADMSRAGEAVAAIAIQLAPLLRKYAGQSLTPVDLLAALQEAETITQSVGASTRAIGQQLRAAHSERAAVTTTGLIPPLRAAFEEVDRALADADTAFLRYQDVRQVLSQFLGVPLPP